MKKSELRQLIKEELTSILKEKKTTQFSEVVIKFTPLPFERVWSEDDFDSNEDFNKFIEKLKSNKKFAISKFFEDIDPDTYDEQLDSQDQKKWGIEIEPV
jgi:hypothetical protein